MKTLRQTVRMKMQGILLLLMSYTFISLFLIFTYKAYARLEGRKLPQAMEWVGPHGTPESGDKDKADRTRSAGHSKKGHTVQIILPQTALLLQHLCLLN